MTSNTACAFVVHWLVKERSYTSKDLLSVVGGVETDAQRSGCVYDKAAQFLIPQPKDQTFRASDLIWKRL